jgi:hypothetical protein
MDLSSSSGEKGGDTYSIGSGRQSCSRSVDRRVFFKVVRLKKTDLGKIHKVHNKESSNIIPSPKTFRDGYFLTIL